MPSLIADLAAEQADLDALVAPLDAAGWDAATPAEGWTIRDSVSHLAFFDETATTATTDSDRFGAELKAVLADGEAYMAAGPERGRAMPARDVLAWWRSARATELAAFGDLDPAAHPLVRPGDEPCVVRDRALDGDVGARTGHRRCPGRTARTHRPAPPRRL